MRQARARMRLLQAARQALRSASARAATGGACAAAKRAPSCDSRCSQARPSGTTSSAAADGVGARTSATKSAIVKSISWPTPVMTGIGAAMDGARHALVVEGPQVLERAAAARQDQHVAVGARRRPDRAPRRLPRPRPRPAPAPGRSAPPRPGKRRARTCRMSRIAAPVGEVMTPMRRGRPAAGACVRWRTGPRPRACAFSSSNCALQGADARRPRGARRRAGTRRAARTGSTRPRASTCWPSRGVKRHSMLRCRNIAQRTCASRVLEREVPVPGRRAAQGSRSRPRATDWPKPALEQHAHLAIQAR